ncbi:MAG: hypothetical protein WC683_07930 [bacterium]|jgi:pyruvate-formate lyase-activating enzyme
MVVDAVCVKTCYDSSACMLYEQGKTYPLDVQRFRDNGLLKYFKTTQDVPLEEARKIEKQADADREQRARAAKSAKIRASA